MTLRKGKPLPLHKPSTMRIVLSAVEEGHKFRREVIKATGLKDGQVRSALHNLVFIGLLERHVDAEGRSIYLPPGTWVGQTAPCLCGVRSIFDVKIIRTDLPCFTTSDNKSNEHP